jgi:hypothetical protein
MHSMLQFHSGSTLVTRKDYPRFRAIRERQGWRYPAYEAYWKMIEEKFYSLNPEVQENIRKKWHTETGYKKDTGF